MADLKVLKALGIDSEAESELIALLDASLDCIKIINHDGTVAFMNSNGLCTMEIDDFDNIKNKQWSDLWPADSRFVVEEAVDRAIQGESVRFEAFCPTAIGRPRWWDVSVSPLRKNDKVVRILAISRDISDRVLREQKASERERHAVKALQHVSGTDDETPEIMLARVGPLAESEQKVDEERRLKRLGNLGKLEDISDPRLDRITRLVTRLLDVPTAMVSLVDSHRQCFVARTGMNLDGTPREESFCAIAIQSPGEPFIVEDASQHPMTADNPLVTQDPSIRAYVGIPLLDATGAALGTLCAVDYSPRQFTKADVDTLQTLAESVSAILELNATQNSLTRMDIANSELKHRIGNIFAQVSSLIGLVSQNARSKDDLAMGLRENVMALSRTQARIGLSERASIHLRGLAEEAWSNEPRILLTLMPSFDVTANAAFLLTLAMKELATNSRKHGALSTPDQTVSVSFVMDGARMSLVWDERQGGEHGGQDEPQAETGSGFGTRLLTRIVPMGLGGESEMKLTPAGLVYRLTVARERIERDPK